ncbi:MAG TPA: hypothetical protein VK489_01890, partial [Ferruginibacter sp.]|nr:hypothetical protein [Ferruginibacter sp.]
MKTKLKRSGKIFLFIFIPLVLLLALFIFDFVSQPLKIDTGIVTPSETFRDHNAGVWAVKFSPDGTLVVSGSIDSTVIIRDRITGNILQKLK